MNPLFELVRASLVDDEEALHRLAFSEDGPLLLLEAANVIAAFVQHKARSSGTPPCDVLDQLFGAEL